MLFREELLSLAEVEDLNTLLTVDRDPTGTWKHHVGLLPTLFEKVKIDPSTTYAAVVGPPSSTSSCLPSCSSSTSTRTAS